MRPPSRHRRSDAATMGPAPNRSEREPRLPLVREIMQPNPTVVSPGLHAGKAGRLMAGRKIGCVVVCRNGSASKSRNEP